MEEKEREGEGGRERERKKSGGRKGAKGVNRTDPRVKVVMTVRRRVE